jgi:acyl-CoA-binding protein
MKSGQKELPRRKTIFSLKNECSNDPVVKQYCLYLQKSVLINKKERFINIK